MSDKPSSSSSSSSSSSRKQRQAEIDAAIASLDAAPTYQKVQTEQQQQQQQQQSNSSSSSSLSKTNNTKSDKEATKRSNKKANKFESTVLKYELPIGSDTYLEIDNNELVATSTAASAVGNNLQSNHVHTITCLALDPTGARFGIGCSDAHLRLFDFAGISSKYTTIRPFTTLLVQEQHRIVQVAYNPNGTQCIVSTGSLQPKILSRDGQEIIQFVRGDVYITDPTKTMGHTGNVTCVDWHPVQKSIVLTGSIDGSVRFWNIEKGKTQFQMLTCQSAIIIKSKNGRKTKVTTLQATQQFVTVGTICGSIQIWNTNISTLRPVQSIYNLPTTTTTTNDNNNNNNDTTVGAISNLIYSPDGTKLAARSSNGHVWVWNAPVTTTSFRMPLLTIATTGAATHSSTKDKDNNDNNDNDNSLLQSPQLIAFSPNSKILCVAITTSRTVAKLQFFAFKKKQKPILEIPYPTGIISIQWHFKLNQLFIADYNGKVRICYHEEFSTNGALLIAPRGHAKNKQQQQQQQNEETLQEIYESRAKNSASHNTTIIITPNSDRISIPKEQQQQQQQQYSNNNNSGKTKIINKSKRQRDADAKASARPTPDSITPMHTSNSNFTQFVVDNLSKKQKTIAGCDPREALFQYQEGKSYISKAYEGNQEKILDTKTVEEEEDAMKQKK